MLLMLMLLADRHQSSCRGVQVQILLLHNAFVKNYSRGYNVHCVAYEVAILTTTAVVVCSDE